MKLNTTRPTKNQQDRLISLINIVFLLLIFFMLTGRIEKKENIPVLLPYTKNLQQIEIQAVTILIDKNNDYYFQDQKLSVNEIIKVLLMLQKNKQGHAEINIAIRADSAIFNKSLNHLLSGLSKAGFAKVQLFLRGI